MQRPLVSIIIPTRNSEKIIGGTLRSIHQQTYEDVEVVVVDNYSIDNTPTVANEFGAKIFVGGPKPPRNNFFTAPVMRQLGLYKAAGKYVYFVDSDMTLTKGLISECVDKCESGSQAVIVPEVSTGTGFWARCKIAERDCYPGNIKIEAPRFFDVLSLRSVGGWQFQAGGMDDWFTHFAFRNRGFKINYSKNFVLHNEGCLSLTRLFRKKFNIGKSTNVSGYLRQVRPEKGLFDQLTPIRFITLASQMVKKRRSFGEVFGAVAMKNIEAIGFYFGALQQDNVQVSIAEMISAMSEWR
jgi:glycosyltransferase involved in cell wall biosynthesis